ncbi:MAG: NifB/NifX family molybdenum-iron cluster-binding protein [Candidatus Ornithospirochaeta sp.]
MRVACPVDEDGFITKVLEDAKCCAFFDVEEDEILSGETVSIPSSRIIDVIEKREAEVLICRNLDIGAMIALTKLNVEIVGGAEGKARKALLSWLDGTLERSDIVCTGSIGGCSGDCSHCHS